MANHDGSPASGELTPAPAAIGAVISASRSSLAVARYHAAVVTAFVAPVAMIGGAWWGFGRTDLAAHVIVPIVVAAPPIAFVALMLSSVLGRRVPTWVGQDGVAIRWRRGLQVIAFRDVSRMNVDESPGSGRRALGSVRTRLTATDRRGKVLLDVQGYSMRRAPSDAACHFIRRASDAWLDWQARDLHAS